MRMPLGKQHPLDWLFFLTPGIFILMTSVTTPGPVFTRFLFSAYFVSWFVLIDLYVSIQSRLGYFLVVPVSLVRSFCSPPEVKCPVFGRLKNGKEKSLYRIFFAILIKVGYIYLSWKRVEPEGSDVDAMGSRDDKPGRGGGELPYEKGGDARRLA